MEKVALNVAIRDGRGKGAARSLRRSGNIPAVIYGQGGSTPVSINRKELSKLISAGAGGNTLLTLMVSSGGEKMAVLRELQKDPLNNEILHADLLEVSMGKALHVTVPVVLAAGTPAGVKEGGILQHLSREIEVACLPNNIPEHIVVDASALKIGESVHVGDLKLPEGVKAVTEAEHVIITIAAPISEEKLDKMLSGEAAEVKEPEVLTKKKEEEEKEKK